MELTNRRLNTSTRLHFGADPEIFLTLDGKVVGAERAIPEDGVHVSGTTLNSLATHANVANGLSMVRDGVQVELNLPPTHCREWLVLEISYAFKRLNEHLKAMTASGRQFEISFRQIVDVDAEELKALSKDSRRLGCAPSFNWYNPMATIGVDPDTYTKRSAAGHLHFGLPPHLMSERERLAPLCDILIGNTCVLIDRDPAQVERRKVYGRAGEFRVPRHGFEYRTPSNFWLRSKELVSFVAGLMRLTTYVLDTAVDEKGWPADQALLDLVSLPDIEKAINNNDLALARANFEGVKIFLQRHLPSSIKHHQETSLDADKLSLFEKFLEGIDEGGIERWFPLDPLTHWTSHNLSWLNGWETFLKDEVGLSVSRQRVA